MVSHSGANAVLQGYSVASPKGRQGGRMLFALSISVRNSETWKVPADTPETLERLIAWKLEELGPKRDYLVQRIVVEVRANLDWLRVSHGSGATWVISMDPIENGGRFEIEFHHEKAFHEGYREFLMCLQFLTKLVAIHRKAASGQEDIRKHRYDAAIRKFAECQDAVSGLLFYVTHVSM